MPFQARSHVDTKVDEQTRIFFYIQTFLLPEDEVTEEFQSFFLGHRSINQKVICLKTIDSLLIVLSICIDISNKEHRWGKLVGLQDFVTDLLVKICEHYDNFIFILLTVSLILPIILWLKINGKSPTLVLFETS